MYSVVKLYSLEKNEINRFLNKFFNENIENSDLLEWEKKYQNPVEMVDIIGTFIDNNDKYSIRMWISLDKGLFINITDYNADNVIRYIYERFPW